MGSLDGQGTFSEYLDYRDAKRAVEEAARKEAGEGEGEAKGEDEAAEGKYCLDQDGEFTEMPVSGIETSVTKDRTSGFTDFTRHIQRRSLPP